MIEEILKKVNKGKKAEKYTKDHFLRDISSTKKDHENWLNNLNQNIAKIKKVPPKKIPINLWINSQRVINVGKGTNTQIRELEYLISNLQFEYETIYEISIKKKKTKIEEEFLKDQIRELKVNSKTIIEEIDRFKRRVSATNYTKINMLLLLRVQ